MQLQLKINGLVTAANEHSRRRDMLLAFSSSPTDLINGLISSQARDLRAQKIGSHPVALRRSQFFDGRSALYHWITEPIKLHLKNPNRGLYQKEMPVSALLMYIRCTNKYLQITNFSGLQWMIHVPCCLYKSELQLIGNESNDDL